jgi:hypothetical protein
MVPQVQVVSILMIVHGALVSLVGIVLAAIGPAIFVLMSAQGRRKVLETDDKAVLGVITVVYGAIGLAVLTAGVLNIVAGARSLKFRGRGLALTALYLNIIPLITCYCAPTSIGMMIYGLIVFFNADVARAFQMAERGLPPEEVRARFSVGPRAEDWDQEEDRWER